MTTGYVKTILKVTCPMCRTTYTTDIDQQDIKTGSLYVDCDHCQFYFLVNISKKEE